MPRFHFHVHDGCSALDAEGTEFPDLQAARLEAIRLAGDILKHDARSITLGEDWRIEAADGAGLILFPMTLLVVEAPVVRGEAVRNAQRR